jgi:hypothetical protein
VHVKHRHCAWPSGLRPLCPLLLAAAALPVLALLPPQVLWSYGERGNDDFFAYHGFVLGDNAHEDVVLFDSVKQVLAWALQNVPGLQGLQEQQQHRLRDVAGESRAVLFCAFASAYAQHT